MIDLIIVDKVAFARSSFPRKFVQDAIWSTKSSYFLRRQRYNSIWWPHPFSTVLQISRSSSVSSDICQMATIHKSKFPSGRFISRAPLQHCCRYRTGRKHPSLKSQWLISTPPWPSRISPSGYLPHFPLAVYSQRASESLSSPQPIKTKLPSSSRHPVECSGGYGYHPTHGPWFSRRGQSRIQQRASGETLLSISLINRRSQWSQSQFRNAPWQRIYFDWGPSISQRQFRFISNNSLRNAYASSCRQGILRALSCSVSRRKKCSIRHCCQNYKVHAETPGRSSFPFFPSQLGRFRVFSQTRFLDSRQSIYCHSSSNPRISPAYDLIQNRRFRLSCSGDQLGSRTRIRLAFLLRSCRSRTFNSGTQKRLQHGENPNTKFFRQCRLSRNRIMGLRSGHEFPISLFPVALSVLEPRTIEKRVLASPCPMGGNQSPKYSPVASRVFPPESVSQSRRGDQKDQTANLSQFANEKEQCLVEAA